MDSLRFFGILGALRRFKGFFKVLWDDLGPQKASFCGFVHLKRFFDASICFSVLYDSFTPNMNYVSLRLLFD